jgi:hypothetical protein
VYIIIAMLDRNLLNEVIRKCLETREIDKRTSLLEYINSLLPGDLKFKIPALVTNNWIDKSLYLLEEKISIV